MRNSSPLITTSIAAAMAVFMLLLVRLTMRISPAAIEDRNATETEEIIPVPSPPPSTINTVPITELNGLQEQQSTIKRLEQEIAEQDQLLQELRVRLEQQEQENQALITRLNTYENTLDMLITQQQQVAGMQRDTDRTQASLLWVGAGLVVVVLIGGALILLILIVLIAFQARNRSPASQVVYTTEVPVPAPPPYPPEQFLPQPRRTRQVYPQDIFKAD